MRRADLKAVLDDLYQRYHHSQYVGSDPLQMPHRFPAREDREVVALLSAAFASGNIKAILDVLEAILAVLGPRPAEWLKAHDPGEISGRFEGIYHRWVSTGDVEFTLALLGEALRRYETLGNLWGEVDEPEEKTTWEGLARFVEKIGALPVAPLERRPRQARRANGKTTPLAPIDEILLTSPRRGSACKRMHLFLRWMARPSDGIDLGLWTEFLDPARLVMPVDVHVLRLSKRLGLTKRKQPDQKAAEEITAALRKICPEDPTRFDFAFVRAGLDELDRLREDHRRRS